MSFMLAKDVQEKTGIDVIEAKRKVILVQRPYFCEIELNKRGGTVQAGIAVSHYGSDAVIKWESKCERRVLLSDTDIEEDDIEIWFEKLDVDSIKRHYARISRKPKIDTGKYIFEVEFDSISWECVYFQFYLKQGTGAAEELKQRVNEYTASWNAAGGRVDKRQGVVHHVECRKSTDEFVEYYMDLGSSDVTFVELFLLYLNRVKVLEKVRVTSFP